jgi:hypothetical protein
MTELSQTTTLCRVSGGKAAGSPPTRPERGRRGSAVATPTRAESGMGQLRAYLARPSARVWRLPRSTPTASKQRPQYDRHIDTPVACSSTHGCRWFKNSLLTSLRSTELALARWPGVGRGSGMGAARVSKLLCTASICAEPTSTVAGELRCLTSGQVTGFGGRSLTPSFWEVFIGHPRC